ncbi:hypothetical protein PFISCL1PPCAC_7194 [Pristionchus fissidentatus]|uniref:Uncharacterized protein n=1 Tax=Pristionchus fissidentatus TaxID=1538716 RepID=A0AAV5VCI3_9BILA|nr:hypothetical protein PFISCL1PPCAC_7194 [Pristionchus fissidentatus]
MADYLNQAQRVFLAVSIPTGCGNGKIEFHFPDGYQSCVNAKDVSIIGSGTYGVVAGTRGTTGRVDNSGTRISVELAVKKFRRVMESSLWVSPFLSSRILLQIMAAFVIC